MCYRIGGQSKSFSTSTYTKKTQTAVHNACMNKPIHWHSKAMNIHELKGRLAFLNQAHQEEAKLLISKLAKNKLV